MSFFLYMYIHSNTYSDSKYTVYMYSPIRFCFRPHSLTETALKIPTLGGGRRRKQEKKKRQSQGDVCLSDNPCNDKYGEAGRAA